MLPEAACQIGLIYSIGIGLPQNDLLAYRWLLFGSAYASDQDRDFWLRLKDDVATRLSQTEIRTIQNDVSELVQKQAVEVNDGRKELLKGYDIAAIQLSNGQPIPVGNIASKQKAHQVSPEQCIGCQLCLDRCPVKAIRIVDSKAVIDKDKCISCGICVNGDGDEYGGCPVSAITVH